MIGYLFAAVPIADQAIVKQISKALDPLPHGELGFNMTATDATGATWAITGFQFTDTFGAQFLPLLVPVTGQKYQQINPALASTFAASIMSGYATRFPTLTPPTAAQIQTFVADSRIITSGYGVQNGLNALGLTLVVPKGPI